MSERGVARGGEVHDHSGCSDTMNLDLLAINIFGG